MSNGKKKKLDPVYWEAFRKVHEWKLLNRGVVQRIADECHTDSALVSQILHGKRQANSGKSAEVYAALKRAGAPVK